MMDKDFLTWLQGLNNDHLRLIIFVTEKCNFRCVYCYETFEKGRISDSVISGIKNLLRKRLDELKTLQLSFFGGEPLLHPDVILDLMSFAIFHSRKDQIIQGDITTNGYFMTPDVARNLLEHNVNSFQITVDGTQNWHDRLRPTAGGKPTFQKIVSNIKNLLSFDRDFSLIVRFNIYDENYDSVIEFMETYEFLSDPRVHLHFHPIFGNPHMRLTRSMETLKELARKKGYKIMDIASVCYASLGNNFIIRSDGTIQKCTVALDDPVNTIGHIAEDGTLHLNTELLRKWVFSGNWACPLKAIQQKATA
ncbi:MAG: radical SAM protein [Chlorobi bacterium]|nr:radical SAM protein [Chlorobiota bacterium]